MGIDSSDTEHVKTKKMKKCVVKIKKASKSNMAMLTEMPESSIYAEETPVDEVMPTMLDVDKELDVLLSDTEIESNDSFSYTSNNIIGKTCDTEPLSGMESPPVNADTPIEVDSYHISDEEDEEDNDEIQRNLLLDQDISDDDVEEQEDPQNNTLLMGVKESLVRELGLSDIEVDHQPEPLSTTRDD